MMDTLRIVLPRPTAPPQTQEFSLRQARGTNCFGVQIRVKSQKSSSRTDIPGHKLVWCCVYPYGVLRAVDGEVGPLETFRQ